MVLAIASGYLYFFPFFEHLRNPNENVRVFMVMAVVDHGTFALNRVIAERGPVDDRATNVAQRCAGAGAPEPCTYSSKAPGTSYLGIPVYLFVRAAYRAAGSRPSFTAVVYFLRLFCVIVPTLLFLVAFDRFLRRFVRGEFERLLVVAATALGTMCFTYAHQFAGHQLVAIFIFASFMLVERAREASPLSAWLIAAAGFAAAYGAISEYPAIVAAAALAIYAAARVGERRVVVFAQFAAGAVVPLSLAVLYHQVCFGRPWRTGYSMLANPDYAQFHGVGAFGIGAPSLNVAIHSSLSPAKGLFFFAPFLLLAFPGLMVMWRRGHRAETLMTAFIITSYLVYQSSVNPDIGGWSIGPRYIVIVVPFLAMAAASYLDERRGRSPVFLHAMAIPLALLSIVFTFVSTIVFHTFPPAFTNPFYEFVLPLARMNYFNYSLGTWLGLRGLVSALPGMLPTAILAAAFCAGPFPVSISTRRARGIATALVVLLLLIGLSRVERFPDPQKNWEFERLTRMWEPLP
jgi:hypothetical protein